MPKMTGKRSFLFLLTICFLCSLVYASVAQAAEILREAVPLERNHVALHLERYIEQDGQSKKPILFVHGVTFSSHDFDVKYIVCALPLHASVLLSFFRLKRAYYAERHRNLPVYRRIS